VHSALAGVDGDDNIDPAGRQPLNWDTPDSDGDFGMISLASFIGGTPGGPVYSVTLWDAETGGAFYGEFPSGRGCHIQLGGRIPSHRHRFRGNERMTIAELIADKLATGLFHPGDPENRAGADDYRLPMFRTVGAPPEVNRQVDLTVKADRRGDRAPHRNRRGMRHRPRGQIEPQETP